MNAPVSPQRPPRSSPLLALGMLGGLGFALWLNAHLGDFTAERGWRAVLQVVALSVAFGAMLHLIATAIERVAMGLQDDLDAITAARKTRQDRGRDRNDAV